MKSDLEYLKDALASLHVITEDGSFIKRLMSITVGMALEMKRLDEEKEARDHEKIMEELRGSDGRI